MAHAALLVDQACRRLSGRLVMPPNITLIPLPAKCPQLNPQENVWQFLRDNWLSNTVFENYDAIVGHCCEAWNKLIAQPWRIMSIGMRDWPMVLINEFLVLYTRPLRQVFCSLSWLPSASSVPWFSSASVRARLAPQRLTIFNPQLLRAEAAVTRVSRQLAAP